MTPANIDTNDAGEEDRDIDWDAVSAEVACARGHAEARDRFAAIRSDEWVDYQEAVCASFYEFAALVAACERHERRHGGEDD